MKTEQVLNFGELTISDIVYCTDCKTRYQELPVRTIIYDEVDYSKMELKLSGMDIMKFPKRESKYRKDELSFTTDRELWKEWIQKIVMKEIEEKEETISSHNKQLKQLQELLIEV